MVDYVREWTNLLLRWAHVSTAVAWIGSYLYFVFLNNSLTKPEDQELKAKGVGGELCAVHGGGFYNPQKYLVAPQKIPQNLHWLYWKSYSTWLTGFSLFTVMYLGFLVVFGLAYDALCKIFDRKKKWGYGRRPCGPWLRGADIRAGMPPVFGAPRISAGRRHDRHNAQVQNKGITLRTHEWVKKNALAMYQQAVVLKLMPINNVTQITHSERYTIQRWFEAVNTSELIAATKVIRRSWAVTQPINRRQA
jgi:uncharacterized membrane protein